MQPAPPEKQSARTPSDFTNQIGSAAIALTSAIQVFVPNPESRCPPEQNPISKPE